MAPKKSMDWAWECVHNLLHILSQHRFGMTTGRECMSGEQQAPQLMIEAVYYHHGNAPRLRAMVSNTYPQRVIVAWGAEFRNECVVTGLESAS